MSACKFRLVNVQLNIKADSLGLKLKTDFELGLVSNVIISEKTCLCSGSFLNEYSLAGISSLMRSRAPGNIFWDIECW